MGILQINLLDTDNFIDAIMLEEKKKLQTEWIILHYATALASPIGENRMKMIPGAENRLKVNKVRNLITSNGNNMQNISNVTWLICASLIFCFGI